jgi:hypothetical protein
MPTTTRSDCLTGRTRFVRCCGHCTRYRPSSPQAAQMRRSSLASRTPRTSISSAHKYQFRALEGWALQQLHAHYARPGALDDGELEQLTDLAALCARSDLLDACVARWKRAVFEGADVARAVGVAERHGLRPLLGLAYHAMLLQGRDVWDADPGLSRARRVRLLSGHYSLGALWAALPASPPPLTHSARCTAPARCAKAWAALWARTLELGAGVLTHAYPDALGKLVMAE